MSKKIILRQSVKSGVAIVFFFGLGMASINAQTTQTTQPTGKVGINTTEPTETLDVKGKVRIQGLYSENDQTGTNNNANFNATNVVTADDNGVLGKKSLSSIIAAQTPNFPWKKVGTTENAVPAEGLKIYSKYAVGIGDYSATNSSVGSSFEINGGNSSQLGLINGSTKWDISTENKALTFTKRKPDNGRIFSVTQDAKLFLGNNLLSEGGSNAKVILDGGNGKIGIGKNSAEYNLDVEGDAKISGLKTTSDNITNGSTTSKYSPAKMVVVDENGVLGKQDFPTIPTIPTIPTEPWQVAGSTTQANANNQNIYQSGKVGIGSGFNTAKTGEGNTDVTIHSQLEISSTDNGRHLGLINGDLKWDLSTENTDGVNAFSITKRHYTKDTNASNNDQGRVLSLTKDAKLFLGNTLKNNNGDNAKILVDGGQGKVAIGKNSASYNLDVAGNTGIKGQLNLIDSSNDNNKFLTYTEGTQLLFDKKIAVPILHTTQTGVMASLTNVGKLYLGNNLTKPDGETLYTKNAKILLDGENGTVGIGKNYTDYDLDVNGYTRISQVPTSNDYAKYYTTENGTRVQKTKTEKYAPKKMVVVDDNGVLGKADIPTGGGSGNGVTKHTGNSTPQCNAANAGTIHYKEEVTVNRKSTSVMGFCMKTAGNKYRWFYIFGGAGTTAGSEADAPNFGEGIQ